MSTGYVGEIRIFGFNFAPIDWAFCQGQLIPISQNEALFSILGTTYGGNGTTNFALPDMRDRAAMSQGQGPGLTNRVLGQAVGTTSVTVTNQQLPAHIHTIQGAQGHTSTQQTGTPTNQAFLGLSNPGRAYTDSAPNQALAPVAIGNAGGSQPHDNVQPLETLNFCICQYGVYPSQN